MAESYTDVNMDIAGIIGNQYRRGEYANIGGNNYLIQCPQTIDENTRIYIAGRGANTITDVYSTFDAAQNANVIVIAPTSEDGFRGVNNVIDSLSASVGLTSPQVTFSGHSAYGNAALEAASEYVNTHNTPTTIVLNDPSTFNHSGDGRIDFDALNGSLIITTAPTHESCAYGDGYLERLKKAAQNGARVLMVRFSTGGHGDSDEVAAALGTYNLSNVSFTNRGTYNNVYNIPIDTRYSYQWIDPNGRLHNFSSAEEAQRYLNNSLIGIEPTSANMNLEEISEMLESEALSEDQENLETATSNEDAEATTINEEPEITLPPTLREFAENNVGGDTLSSNLSYVSQAMSGIQSQITERLDLNYQKSSDTEANVVSSLYSAANYYGSVTNLLYGKLGAETEAVYSIANSIYQMDQFGSLMAESTLTGEQSSALFGDSNPSVNTALELLKTNSLDLVSSSSAVLANGRFEELTSVLGVNLEPGSVGRLSVSSLNGAIKTILPTLDQDIAKATELSASVDDFMTGIGANNILQGGVWEAVKTNMGNYQNLLSANVKASEFMSDTIKTAMGMIVNYIQNASDTISAIGGTEFGNLVELEELDDSKLPELESAIKDMERKITDQEDFIAAKEALPDDCDEVTDPVTGEKGYINCRRPYSASELQGWKDALADYVEIKTSLSSYKDVLNGFAPVVQAAQSLINESLSQVKTMYDSPVTDTNGNITFNTDFKLDLSPYSDYIDTGLDYKQLIDDYHTKLLEEDNDESEKTQDGTDPVGDGDNYPDNNPNNENTTTTEPATVPQTQPVTEPRTEAPTKPPKGPENRIDDTPTEPIIEIPDDEIIDYPVLPDKDGYVNVPYGPYFNEEDKPQITLLDSSMEDSEVIDFNKPIELDNPYYEPKIEQPKVTSLVHSTISEPVPKPESTIKTMGVATGAGIALGAAALAKKDDEDEEEDFGFEK